eukprot:201478_1
MAAKERHSQPNKEKSTLLVAGYNRHMEKQLNKQSIPNGINLLCFSYYFLTYSMTESQILTAQEKQIFGDLLKQQDNTKQTNTLHRCWQLIFRATRDGWTGDIFHDICDKKAPSITIIETVKGNVFGGFTNVEFNGNDWGLQKDENAFIFLIRSTKGYKPQIFNVTQKMSYGAMQNYGRDCMCSFGGVRDMFIASNCNVNHYSCSEKEYYPFPETPYLTETKYFTVKEVEVFNLFIDIN